jgi:hypothetical protein
MAQCITCGTQLHPERAQKYNYCMAPKCQEKNAKGLTMVAVGMNKAADELVLLDEHTREALANGKYQDQRRGSFGPLAPSPTGATPSPTGATPAPAAAAPSTPPADAAARAAAAAPGTTPADAPARAAGRPARRRRPQPSRPASASATGPRWTASQERLALLYNQQGLRPDEIADKLGVSTYLATQIVLAARSHRRA